MAKRYENNIVLAFGDTHFPYQHQETIPFLKEVKELYKPERVIHMGDILDVYSVSSYPTDPDHPDSWSHEIRKAREGLKELYDLFPEVDVMSSNHDDRPYKKSRIAGIPREFLVSFKDIIGAPEGWKWHADLRITVDSTREKLYFAHTKNGGQNAALNTAKDMGCTVALGHNHTRFGATAFKPHKRVIYGVDVGCLVSDKGAPYDYNKGTRGRPIQGCFVFIDGEPIGMRLK